MVNEKIETMFPDINLKLEDGLNSKDFLTFARSMSKLNNCPLYPYQEKMLYAMFDAGAKKHILRSIDDVGVTCLVTNSIRGKGISWAIIDDEYLKSRYEDMTLDERLFKQNIEANAKLEKQYFFNNTLDISNKINIALSEANKLIKLVSLGKNANLKSKAYSKIRKSRVLKNRVKLYNIYFGSKIFSIDSLSVNDDRR